MHSNNATQKITDSSYNKIAVHSFVKSEDLLRRRKKGEKTPDGKL